MMRDLPGEITTDSLQIIIDETKRLNTLIDAVMDYSRLQSDSFTHTDSKFNLTLCLQRLIQRYTALAGSEGYNVVFNYDTQVDVVENEAQLTQVVCNLINNAITYTGEDKSVTLTQTLNNGWVTLSIEDTGAGIPAEELPLIWQRYYRSKQTHKRDIVGSGLGLSIVQKILEKHHYPYGVDSEPGKGARFWFSIPIN